MTLLDINPLALALVVGLASVLAIGVGVAVHELLHYGAAWMLGLPAWFERDGLDVYTVFDVPTDERQKGYIVAATPGVWGWMTTLGWVAVAGWGAFAITALPIWVFLMTVALPLGGDLRPFAEADSERADDDSPAGV